jgi:photosystem II stability/assembly factor-like uncharacterized protein
VVLRRRWIDPVFLLAVAWAAAPAWAAPAGGGRPAVTHALGSLKSQVRTLRMVSATEGWALPDDGGALHTTDGGATWSVVAGPVGTTPILAADGSLVWMGSGDVADLDGASISHASFVDAKVGWAIGIRPGCTSGDECDDILATTDGGRDWKRVASTVDQPGWDGTAELREAGHRFRRSLGGASVRQNSA